MPAFKSNMDFVCDESFYFCEHDIAGTRANAVLCGRHIKDKGIKIIRQNGHGVRIRNPACLRCDVERSVKAQRKKESLV